MKRIIRIVIVCSFLLTSLGVVPGLADPDDPPPIYIPLVVNPSGFTVTGAVLDADHYPVAGALVTDIHGASATTDANGTYALHVRYGNNTLTATRKGYSIAPLNINVATSLTGVNFGAQVGCGSIVVNEQLTVGMGGWEFLTDQEDDVVPGTDTITFNSAPSSGRVGINTGVDNNVASTTRARSQEYHVPSDADLSFLGVWVNRLDTGAGEIDRQFIDILDEDDKILSTLNSAWDVTVGWTYLEFPLDAFIGETIKIQFRVVNDGGAFSSTMFFDDVTLILCNTHCDNQIINSGFEVQDPAESISGWLFDSPQVVSPFYSMTYAHPPSLWSMRTGIAVGEPDLEAFTEVFQRNIELPSDQSGAMLTFWIYRTRVFGSIPPIEPAPPAGSGPTLEVPVLAGPASRGPSMVTGTPEEDWQYLYILDDDGNFIEKPFWQVATNDNAWVRYRIDLSDFMGQQIELKFGTYNDGRGGPSAMYIDDVVLGTCD